MQVTTGVRVLARGLTWDVLERESLGDQERLRLRCVSDDLRGLEWDLLRPQETVELLRDALTPNRPGPLAAWRLFHQACLLEQIPGTAEMVSATPGRLRIEPYQLVPLMRALELPRPRLLLADGVGLGKTIEAGLIAAELIARRRAHRILIAAPAGPLLRQWEQEMRHRFGLRFSVLADSAALRTERRALEMGGNPFAASAFVLTSLDFAKQEAVLEELERTAWDLVIIDEAHHCVSAAGATAREDTLRRRLAEVLARQSDGLLLLSATPHDGYDPHFASLMALLDPSLVDGRGGLSGLAYRRHVVRRLKSHIADPATGRPLFRERLVVPVPVAVVDPAVKSFHRALSALVAPRLSRTSDAKKFGDSLAFVSLLKRSVSTVAACVATLRVVADRYAALTDSGETDSTRRERARTLRAYRRRALRFGVLDSQTETDVERLEAEDIAAELRTSNDTEAALRGLMRLGEDAAEADPKLEALVTEIRLIRAAEPRANVLVYTEYGDSQDAAVRVLRAAPGIAGEILTIAGPDDEETRTRAAERCAAEDGLVLISTDSLAEGLNLQQRCHHLIHLDLPYNPNRLEQRNGRIDRYGQTEDPQIRYLCLAGTFEERLLLRLIAKYEKARAQLTFMPDTLGMTVEDDRLGDGLLTGLAEEQATLFPEDKPVMRTLDVAANEEQADAYRDLLREIDRAYEGFDGMAVRHGWFAGQGLRTEAALMHAATDARRAAKRHAATVDLVDFVSEAVGPFGRAAPPATAAETTLSIAIPSDWEQTLHGLPGCAPNLIRVTRDPTQIRDPAGASLVSLGRAHPAVRKAIGLVRQGNQCRVSVARHDRLALLLTYTMEMHTHRYVASRRLTGVLLTEEAPPKIVHDPVEWLSFSAPGREVEIRDPWRRFATWAPPRLPEVEAAASAVMQQWAADFTARHESALTTDRANFSGWIERRADTLCGPRQEAAIDLFVGTAQGPAWRIAPDPFDRLAAFASDRANSAVDRREAEGTVAFVERRSREMPTLLPPVLHRSGLLMLVPER